MAMEDWWKHKLFQPKNFEGKPTKEELEYIRNLFEFASKADSRLKGITIIGSTLKGYSKPGSDIDIKIICDDSPGVDPYGHKIFDFFAEFKGSIERLNKKIERAGSKVFKVEEVGTANVNYLTPEGIRNIANDLGALWSATSLVFPGVGDLETYRKIIRDQMKTYPSEERERWLDYVTKSIVSKFDSGKFIERGTLKKEDEEEFLKARQKLIEARVRRIFG